MIQQTNQWGLITKLLDIISFNASKTTPNNGIHSLITVYINNIRIKNKKTIQLTTIIIKYNY